MGVGVLTASLNVPLKGREAICEALREYGYSLPVEQGESLERYCG